MSDENRHFPDVSPVVGSRRKKRLVDRSQQFRFGVAVAFYAFLILIFFFSITLYPPLLTLLVGGEEEAMRAYRTAVLQFAGNAIQYWWISLLGFLLVGCASVVHSHRIFGPMRRFEDALWNKKTEPEDGVDCKLRRGDYFQGFSYLLETVLNESHASPPVKQPEPVSRPAEPVGVHVP